ncbi:rRNA adenine methyltransferase [Niabella hibiscisoli]|uniref:rRNA adenine methyltransferase n=1 Tax=Niabella hibiscisoli TaxID=1825928 RepID=UPI001F0E3E09|nr:rRNA adenine methyltransferase [Niabella hibiscisoli]MCH5719214.1 rRNA adenine methyltransferase [Niabella hibiscisoli]
MQFDENNEIVRLCAEGMELEGQGKKEEASKLFKNAWDKAANDFEKFISAHYVARHQETIEDKLHWDKTSLTLALRINDHNVKGALPSLYLNIAKCYEDLNDLHSAKANYEEALLNSNLLPDDGYGNMITGGIINGIQRVKLKL